MNFEKTRHALSGYPLLVLGILLFAAAIVLLVQAIRSESPLLLLSKRVLVVLLTPKSSARGLAALSCVLISAKCSIREERYCIAG